MLLMVKADLWAIQQHISRITKVPFIVVEYNSFMIPGDISSHNLDRKISNAISSLYSKWSAVKELHNTPFYCGYLFNEIVLVSFDFSPKWNYFQLPWLQTSQTQRHMEFIHRTEMFGNTLPFLKCKWKLWEEYGEKRNSVTQGPV